MFFPERSSNLTITSAHSILRGRWVLLLAAVVLHACPAAGQTVSGPPQLEISSISFDGNATLGRNELLPQMATKETPGFFNKFLHTTISEKLGRKNEYFNSATFSADLKRLRLYYQNRGFNEVIVDSSLVIDERASSVDITIRFTEGYRSLIDSLSYVGIGLAPGVNWEEIVSSPKIAAGDPFNGQLLEQEVNRVLKVLSNAGYPNAIFVRDSSWARRFASTRNYKVQLTFNLGKMYYFGDVTIRQEIDSLRAQVRREDITDDILIRQLTYTPGKHYNVDDSVASVGNLNRLGIFDLRRMDMHVPARSDTSVTVPTTILIRPKDKYELGPEIIVSDENGSLNLGTGLSYMQRNFFGGARIFSARLRFRTQTLREFPDYFGKNTDAVSNLDLTFEVVQPFVLSNRIKGSWSFSYILDKQKPYLQNIFRNKFGFASRFAEFTNGFLDWTLEAIGSEQNDNFLGSTDPEIQRLRLFLQKPQFNSILSFTIQRDVTNDPFSPSEGFIHSATFDEAILTPMILQGIFPNLPLTQFYRISLIGRWYTDLTTHRFSILAFKAKAGIEDKYGKSRSDPERGIPQTYRFYAGGGNSVRGWNSRDLIASGDPLEAQLGGNVSMEGSIELRTNILQGLKDGVLDKIWLVQFLDIGNVWGELKDVTVDKFAIAAGFGLRYETFFGPFRIDWGFRVYNPGETEGSRWITQRQLFGQTFKEAIYHFGIGHAF